MVLARNGVRPSPPPTMTSKPISPASLRCSRSARSWMRSAARSWDDAPTAILNLRGMKVNSGCSVTCWRITSAQNARILDLVGRHAGPLVGGDVAHAIAAGLHAVHADAGEVGHGVGQFGELDPVELDVLPRGEMAVAAIVAARDMRQHAQLRRRQRAVGDGDAQHIGVKLQVDAVHQAQRLEFLLGQLAGQPARDLIAKFGNALGDERPVECVIDVHGRLGPKRLRCRRSPAVRWSDRQGE